jgi:spore maturation protein CgeB
MKIAFYGSSLLSSFWNGAATYYRGVLRQLAHRGWDVHFYEPDAFDRQQHRDMDPPDWAKVTVWEATPEDARRVMAQAAYADVVVKASGVGVFDDELLHGLLDTAAPEAVRMFCDVDAAATLDEMRAAPDHPLRKRIGDVDLVTTYGGGPPVIAAYTEAGARRVEPIYNALDPETHHPVDPDPRFAADLNFLANRLPDREARVEAFFLRAAELLPDKRFLLGGNGWDGKPMTDNVQRVGHVGTGDHNAFNTSSTAILNVARDSMAAMGFSPATRVFEAAGAGACLITDAWEGIEMFLQPNLEVLVARDGQDVAEHVRALSPERAAEIGRAGRARILAEHTYEKRGAQLDAILREEVGRKRAGGARTLGGSAGATSGAPITEGRFA